MLFVFSVGTRIRPNCPLRSRLLAGDLVSRKKCGWPDQPPARPRRLSGDDKEQARKRHRQSAQRRAARCSPLPNPQLNEDALERTETGEGILKHVEADEGRKEEPPFVDEVPESETREHEGASDEKDDALSSHNFDDKPSVLARPILCKNCLKLTGCCAFAAA